MSWRWLRTFACCTAVAGFLAVPAAASQQLCGASVDQVFSGIRSFSKDYSATCQPGSACAVVTHMLNDDAPLGFSHVFGFRRETKDGRWHVMLLDEMQQTNAAAGMELRVDDGKPLSIAPAMISVSEGGNAFTFNPQLTELILAEAKPGNRLSISYTSKSGAELTASFSLIGLTDALEWSTCAQGELASGKSDAASQAEEEKEYSGPEPGVPVSPDDSQD